MTAYHPILPFISRLKIVDKELQTRVLGRVLNPPQRRLIADVEEDIRVGRPIRYITLKARQVGISTVTEAMAFQWMFCLPRSRGLIVSHTGPSTNHLLDMTHHYWTTWWANPLYKATSSARDRLKWSPTQSEMSVMPAKTAEGARSRTLHFVHASETAFWPHPGELMYALQAGVPKTALSAIFIESTANGVGNWFHEMWEAAKRGEVDFKPRFFAWWRHPEYHAHQLGRGDDAAKLLLTKQINGGTLDEEEWILKTVLANSGMDDAEIQSRLLWRRLTVATEMSGDLDKFHQEYPATDDEAFLSTGRNVFTLKYLRTVYEPLIPDVGKLVYDPTARDTNNVRFIPDPAGPLRIYEYPSPNPSKWYMVGIDNSKATMFGDFSVGQVIKRDTLEQVAVWRERGMNDVVFAEQMRLLGYFYNTAMLAPEYNMNGAGINALIEANYPRYYVHRKAGRIRGMHESIVGWPMTEQTKQECMANLQREVFAGYEGRSEFLIHDPETYFEMKNYVINDRGKYENAKQAEHDDTVTSLAIGVSAAIYERPGLATSQMADFETMRAERAKAANPDHDAIAAGIRNVGEHQGGVDVAMRSEQDDTRQDTGGRQFRLPPDINPFASQDVDLYNDGEW